MINKVNSLDFSELEKEINSPSLISLLSKTVDMIVDDNTDYFDKVKSDTITIDDKFSYEVLFPKTKLSLYDYIDTSIFKRYNNSIIKIFYINDQTIDQKYYANNKYCPCVPYGKINKIDNNITCFRDYFIPSLSEYEDKETAIIAIISNILASEIESYIIDKYNVDFEALSKELERYLFDKIYRTYTIPCVKIYVDYAITYYRILDMVFNLRYEDFEKVSRLSMAIDYFMPNIDARSLRKWNPAVYNLEELCYKYAITTSTDYNDYLEVLKQVYLLLFPAD
jgi:hypothetical protein